MRIGGKLQEHGIPVGNVYDKYHASHPVARFLMRRFESALDELLRLAGPETVHEVGCGEGYWVLHWSEAGIKARGSDFSDQVLRVAEANARQRGLSPQMFSHANIYELDSKRDSADLIVCCEVLEHLENPSDALRSLQAIVRRHIIISVPREPLWRLMNLAGGRYVVRLGNTPGHLQHWSRRRFIQAVSTCFEVLEVRTPIPWTMLLCRPRALP
jgi:2-polyprenyl-3-methyl-5-hydroxy-6-metoxy-1,4-benzoquinol methylase